MFKLSPKILFLILACALSSNGVKLKCNFINTANGHHGTSYYCKAVDNGIYYGWRVKIDEIEGAHLDTRTNDEVEAVYFSGITAVTYFPQNMDKFFANLIGIYFDNCNFEEITQQDLMPFSKLKELYLRHTKVTTIPENLFKFNPEIKTIRLYNNQIYHIDPNVFDGLTNLGRLFLSGNKCRVEFGDVSTRTEVMSYVTRIQNGECSSIEILQQKFKDAQNALIQNITILQAENQEYSAKNEEMKLNLAAMTKDLSELRIKYENLLINKLTEAVKFVEKFVEKKIEIKAGESLSEDQEKKDCLSFYYGPNQRPIILTN